MTVSERTSASEQYKDREMSEIGENEFASRMADIAEVKAGTMTLEQAKKNCRRRQRESGLTPSMFYQELILATGRSRMNDLHVPLIFQDEP